MTCKNRLPYNLYCVGGDVKHWSLTHPVTDAISSFKVGCFLHVSMKKNKLLIASITKGVIFIWCKIYEKVESRISRSVEAMKGGDGVIEASLHIVWKKYLEMLLTLRSSKARMATNKKCL